jgi:TPR repeat protein
MGWRGNWARTILAFGILLSLAACASSVSQTNDCDRLAASPDDPGRRAPGVAVIVDPNAAIAACKDVLADADVRLSWRTTFQLGRALEAAKRDDEAIAAYRELAESIPPSYPPAVVRLGEMYEQGIGVPVDYGAAAHYYRLAIRIGDSTAKANLASLAAAHGLPPEILPVAESSKAFLPSVDQFKRTFINACSIHASTSTNPFYLDETVTDPAHVEVIYRGIGERGWYEAYIRVRISTIGGAAGTIYVNPGTLQVVCGDGNWKDGGMKFHHAQ